MYALRHPLYRDVRSSEKSACGTGPSSGSPMTPSVPGIAFAVVAAALPLLRDRNFETSCGRTSIFCGLHKFDASFYAGVLQLVKIAIPFLTGYVDDHSPVDESSSNWTIVRFQHLLRRMDQVCALQHLSFCFITHSFVRLSNCIVSYLRDAMWNGI